MEYIEFENVNKKYKMGEVIIDALDNTNFQINRGELVVIVGPSGAGKTTTLNILGGMDTVTSGNVYVDGKLVGTTTNQLFTVKLSPEKMHSITTKCDGYIDVNYNVILDLFFNFIIWFKILLQRRMLSLLLNFVWMLWMLMKF